MVVYEVIISPEFQAKFEKLDKGVQDRARKELQHLPFRNHKQEALGDRLVGFYSHHFWNNKYRIIYTIQDHILKILALWIGKKHDDFYKDLEKYLKKTRQL